jgi:hypothetical protein
VQLNEHDFLFERTEKMEPKEIILTNKQFSELNRDFPIAARMNPTMVGSRAERIVEFYLKKEDANCTVKKAAKSAGADLVLNTSGEKQLIEVKGTSDDSIAWSKLVVSSDNSFKQLSKEKDKVPIYRVTNVFGRKCKIYILWEGIHFTLGRVSRWQVNKIIEKPKKSAEKTRRALSKRRYPGAHFARLHNYLSKKKKDVVKLTFNKIEKILKDDLPRSAYDHSWWRQKNPHIQLCKQAGYIRGYKNLSQPPFYVEFYRVD